MTSKYRAGAWIFGILSVLLNVCPLAVYVIQGLVSADLVVEKVGLSCTVFAVLILSVVSFINKTSMRSRVWLLIIGLWFCLDNFITPLIIIAVCQVLDEWIINPLYRHFKNKYSINKEIDKRF